ncbi:phage tail protein [Streptomyces solincola]|uniref:Phage tail protein n=1 Tax=Streptomyces solincola TaxID=2100817 RepID=A0A2S9Q2I4_9ACTN|nr:phage tail protein [Streptomyces solincola]PRH80884.1 phage tail protein [Streptomyces solincola]
MLPSSIPTVTVTARYLTPDGKPMSGSVEFRPPSLLTHSGADVFLGGPTLVPLDAEGRLRVVLPATDAEGFNPAVWTYQVTEKLAGIARNRAYQLALPAALPEVDLADLAPADPATPTYVAVPGPPGPRGDTGPAGPPGPVRSVNGRSTPDITLTAADLAAIPVASAGAVNGVATLGANGKIPAAQLPATSQAVSSVNGKTGAVVLTAADLSALTPAAGDARYLGIDAAPVKSVNGQSGAVQLRAADVSAVAAGDAVLLTGDQTVAGAKTFAVPPATTADPANANHLVRRGYVDTVSAAGTWSPGSMGFAGWAFDPAASSANSVQYCMSGWLYLIGIPLHAPTTVRNIVFYVPGYVGNTLGAASFAGLYTAAGAKVGTTATLNTLLTATEGKTAVLPLTATYNAAPGSYWVALLVNGPNPANTGPAFMRGASMGQSPGGSARMPNHFIRHGRLSTTGMTSLPNSFPLGNVVPDSNAIWAALA